jgi:hypothetical protein
MTWIQIAHQVPGRTRLRAAALRRDEGRCEQIADALAAVPGVREVAARPYTGGVLVHHKRDVSANTLVDVAARVLGADVLAPGARPPMVSTAPPFSSVARKLVHAIREIETSASRRRARSISARSQPSGSSAPALPKSSQVASCRCHRGSTSRGGATARS